MLTADIIALGVFAVLSLCIAAIGLMIRDLAFASPSSDQRAPRVGLRNVPDFVRGEVPGTITGRLDKTLYQLTNESGLDCSIWSLVLLMIICAIGGGGLTLLFADDVVLATVVAGIAMFLPLPLFAFYRRRRLARMRHQLPDALDLLARAVSAGESLDQAVQLVGTKTAAPLSLEFRQCARQLELGLAVPAAVRAMAKRVPLMEMRILSATLSVYRQTGGSLASTLSQLAKVCRERLAYQRQLRATTAAGRFSATIVAMVGPMLLFYLMIFQPDYFNKLISIRLGQYLLGIAFVLEVVGIVWVMSLLRQRI